MEDRNPVTLFDEHYKYRYSKEKGWYVQTENFGSTMEELKLMRWAEDGFPPIILNDQLKGVIDLINEVKRLRKLVPKPRNRKKSKIIDLHPAYPEFVRLWTEAYPELGFNALSGKKIKSLISQSEAILTGAGKVPTPEAAGHLFAYMLAYVKREGHWLRGKSIAVWDSKYREIYFEIKNGKSRAGKKESASEYIDRYFGQAG